MEPPVLTPLTPRGFSLIELIVVMAIMIALTLIVLLSQSTFNRTLLLTNTAYTVALSIREAQSLGLASRQFGSVQNAAYGVHISNDGPTHSYRIFSDIVDSTGGLPWCPDGTPGTPEDKPGNCLFESASETVTTYRLNKGFTISDFCGIDLYTGQRRCASDSLHAMNIAFLRPNTESVITATMDSGARPQACAVIWLAPSGGAERKCVVVSQVGQVAVQQSCPAANFTACP